MKNITRLPIFIICLVFGIQLYANNPSTYEDRSLQNAVTTDSLLLKIQDKIHLAFAQDMEKQTSIMLPDLYDKLSKLNKTRNNNIVTYWSSYTQFYLTIYFMQTNDQVKAKKTVDLGVSLMDEMPRKTSDDYVLLSRLQGLSLQFAGMKAMFISQAMIKNGKIALELDENNIRANFIYANNDFFTPAIYGGGKKAEKYFLKAIALPSQLIQNDYLPSWGKEESYEYLIRLYIRNKQWDSAKKYSKEALYLFPDNFLLNQLSDQLDKS